MKAVLTALGACMSRPRSGPGGTVVLRAANALPTPGYATATDWRRVGWQVRPGQVATLYRYQAMSFDDTPLWQWDQVEPMRGRAAATRRLRPFVGKPHGYPRDPESLESGRTMAQAGWEKTGLPDTFMTGLAAGRLGGPAPDGCGFDRAGWIEGALQLIYGDAP